jgi:hypothetical protein
MAALAIASSFVPVSDEKFIRKLMIVGIVILIGWIATTALHVCTVVYLRRFKLDSEDNLWRGNTSRSPASSSGSPAS